MNTLACIAEVVGIIALYVAAVALVLIFNYGAHGGAK